MAKIFLDGNEFQPAESDLPILVHGKEKSGSSFFSILLISKFIQAGHHVLFFTKHKDAYEELKRNIDANRQKDLDGRVKVAESGNIDAFCELLGKTDNLENTIVFIKNSENLLTAGVFEKIKDLKKLVVSGDIDQSANRLIDYNTMIFFSPSKYFPEITRPAPYKAVLVGKKINGIISTDK